MYVCVQFVYPIVCVPERQKKNTVRVYNKFYKVTSNIGIKKNKNNTLHYHL